VQLHGILVQFDRGQAEGEANGETACFKPRWKTIITIIDGNGSLEAESSSLYISCGSQNKEDVPTNVGNLSLQGNRGRKIGDAWRSFSQSPIGRNRSCLEDNGR